VHLFENVRQGGGLLRYAFPTFKMEKGVIDRRVTRWRAKRPLPYNSHVGADGKSIRGAAHEYDASR